MKKIIQKTIHNIYIYRTHLSYILCFVVCLTFLAVTGIRTFRDTRENMNLEKVNFLIEEQGNADNNYTWTGHFEEDINNNQLMLFLHYARLTITKNDEFYGEYGYQKLSIGKTHGEEWECFEPASFSKNDTIKFKIENVYQKDSTQTANLMFSRMFVGDKMSLLTYNIRLNAIQIILSILIIIIGLLMIVVISTLKSMGMKTPTGYMMCGALMVIGATCAIIDYDYISLIFNNTFIFMTIDLLTQTLIVEMLLMFMKVFIRSSIFQKITGAFLKIWTLMILAYIILQGFNILDGVELIPFYIVPAILMIVVEIVFMIIDYRNYRDYLTGSVIYTGIILCFFTFIEMIHFAVTKQFYIIAFLFGLLIFTIAQFLVMMRYIKDGLEQTQRANELEKELMQSRVSIMLSQIQPHFLYNSLGSISQLCTENPKKAERALDQFADFLRGNMLSLSCVSPIGFRQELSHLNNYIALEKIRFGDRIRVKYELEVEDFKIPALSLQPIVENSIKYGITKKREGGTVTIKTQKIDHEVKVTISDDGVGFDPSEQKQDGRAHIGIKNVQSRIHEMCHGQMVIDSKPGSGTIVTITLKEDNSNEDFNM